VWALDNWDGGSAKNIMS